MDYWSNGLLRTGLVFRQAPVNPPLHHSITPFPFARVVQQQRHDVESVASAGATPAASTNRRMEWWSNGLLEYWPKARLGAPHHSTASTLPHSIISFWS